MKDFTHDYYTGLKGIYFYSILKKIIKIGGLKENKIILDFGCGVGKLKKLIGNKVINYDPIIELSEVRDWKECQFDIIVVNEVLYLFKPTQIRQWLRQLRKVNHNVQLIVGIARENSISNILSIIAGEPDAHKDRKTSPQQQLEILKEEMHLISKSSVFGMCDIYLLNFKSFKRER